MTQNLAKEVEQETPKQQNIEVAYHDGYNYQDDVKIPGEVVLYEDIIGFQSDRNFFGIMNKKGETFGLPVNDIKGFRSFFVEV